MFGGWDSCFLWKGFPLRRAAYRSLSHKAQPEDHAILEIGFWAWEAADRETDSKYICFYKSLLFSVLTAIKTTWN